MNDNYNHSLGDTLRLNGSPNQINWSNLNLVGTIEKYKEVKNKSMENLYNVIVIDKERDILIDKKVVAKNPESAKFNAEVYDHLKKSGLTLDDVTVIVNQLGTVEVAEYLE